jgi:tetratricopeptide (TPR) repeat protein
MRIAAFVALIASVLGEEQAAPKDASKLVSQADREFRNDRADAALKLYTEALSLEKSPKTYYARHKVYLKKGKLQAAIKDLTTAVDLDPAYSMAYLQRANLWLTIGRCDDAATDYKKALELDPNKKDAQVRLPHAQACSAALVRADVAERNRNWPAAISALSDAMSDGRATASPTLLLRRARMHLESKGPEQAKGLEQAMSDSAKAIKLDSSNAQAYALRGRVLQQHGDYSTAKAHFGECMEVDPDLQVRGG